MGVRCGGGVGRASSVSCSPFTPLAAGCGDRGSSGAGVVSMMTSGSGVAAAAAPPLSLSSRGLLMAERALRRRSSSGGKFSGCVSELRRDEREKDFDERGELGRRSRSRSCEALDFFSGECADRKGGLSGSPKGRSVVGVVGLVGVLEAAAAG